MLSKLKKRPKSSSNARTVRARERDGEKIVQLNKSLELRLTELRATNEELEAFTYSVSHDLRSPLRAIDGFSAALVRELEEQLEGKQLHYLQRVRSGAGRMGQLIDDLLKLSRSTRGELVRDDCNLTVLAQKVLDALLAKSEDRKVKVDIAERLSVNADCRFLRVVLENLLGNALKYTSKTLEPFIRVEGWENGFAVIDNGAGFDMTYADNLYQPFQRLHDDSEFEGSGIGLSTVKRIVKRHGGEISAQSVPGKVLAFS
jgi:signal transduction histidine kinase